MPKISKEFILVVALIDLVNFRVFSLTIFNNLTTLVDLSIDGSVVNPETLTASQVLGNQASSGCGAVVTVKHLWAPSDARVWIT